VDLKELAGALVPKVPLAKGRLVDGAHTARTWSRTAPRTTAVQPLRTANTAGAAQEYPSRRRRSRAQGRGLREGRIGGEGRLHGGGGGAVAAVVLQAGGLLWLTDSQQTLQNSHSLLLTFFISPPLVFTFFSHLRKSPRRENFDRLQENKGITTMYYHRSVHPTQFECTINTGNKKIRQLRGGQWVGLLLPIGSKPRM